MIGFWILAVAMAAVVAGLLVRAVLRDPEPAVAAEAFDLSVYRGQLTEIDRDEARGIVAPEEAERLRLEVSRRILNADSKAQGFDATRATSATGSKAVMIGVAVAIVAGAAGIYAQLGAPGYSDMPLQARKDAAAELRNSRPSQEEAEFSAPAPAEAEGEFKALVDRLRVTLEERPDDLEGHILLVRAEASLGNFAAARKIQTRVIDLRGDAANATDYTDLADMMVLAANGYVSPEAQGAIETALKLEPNNPVARYYAGLMMNQIGRPDIAFRMWDQLLRDSPSESGWVPLLRQQLPDVALRAGVLNYQLPAQSNLPPAAALPGPSQDDVEAAQDMSAEDRMEMIQGMVSGLSERLATEGGTAQEWARLINALGVLGDTDQAAAIWSEAQTVFAQSPEALELIRSAAANAGVSE